VPHHFLFLSRHFGTGVLIATAFIHLFPTAYISLTDPCLPEFWNTGYPAMPGLIAMLSVFAVIGIEMYFAMRGAGHVHGTGFEDPALGKRGKRRSFDSVDFLNDVKLDEFDSSPSASSSLLENPPAGDASDVPITPTPKDPEAIHPEPNALRQCLLLEAGILFHSVFIGMAISVTPVPAFYVFLLAITFHQTFEGLALGARISALSFHPRSIHPWLMALAYGTTAPLGQAIGLAIHSVYDPASQSGLLSVGIMNALSSGLLLFAGLVQLLAEDFLSPESYVTLKGRKRAEACVAVVAGAGLMALVGAWA
jgi:zinc transporter 1/2/3